MVSLVQYLVETIMPPFWLPVKVTTQTTLAWDFNPRLTAQVGSKPTQKARFGQISALQRTLAFSPELQLGANAKGLSSYL
jgi:hypothetical protein